MKLKQQFILVLSFVLLFGLSSAHAARLIVYTSMKESLIGALKADFIAKNPDIEMDYQSAGAGKLMAKIAAEKESGRIMADIIWTSEVPDFYNMKKDGILLQYVPKENSKILNPLESTDNYFFPARLGTLGIVYNTKDVKNPPKEWKDLLGKEYKGAFSIANPALSGTSYVSVAMLQKAFGDKFYKDLRANGAKVGKGSGQVVDDTASGELAACLGVDYIANDKIEKGAYLGIAYPKELLVIPSPIAILKDTKQLDNAKRFIDYVMTKDAQQIIANNGTLPVRADVNVPAKFKLPTPQDAMKNGIKVDYIKMIAEKEARVKAFLTIMQK